MFGGVHEMFGVPMDEMVGSIIWLAGWLDWLVVWLAGVISWLDEVPFELDELEGWFDGSVGWLVRSAVSSWLVGLFELRTRLFVSKSKNKLKIMFITQR